MNEVTLNWETARVQDGRLEVELEGEARGDWKRRFERTVTLLSRHGDWGRISVKRHKIKVRDVRAETAENLRHLLESAAAEANATDRATEAGEAANGAPRDPAEVHDREMTAMFRSFAGEQAGARAEDAR